MKIIAILIVVIVLGLMAYVRFMPVDAVRWHEDIAAPGYVPAGNAATFCAGPGARVTLEPGQLEALDRIALATPRTTRAGGECRRWADFLGHAIRAVGVSRRDHGGGARG